MSYEDRWISFECFFAAAVQIQIFCAIADSGNDDSSGQNFEKMTIKNCTYWLSFSYDQQGSGRDDKQAQFIK